MSSSRRIVFGNKTVDDFRPPPLSEPSVPEKTTLGDQQTQEVYNILAEARRQIDTPEGETRFRNVMKEYPQLALQQTVMRSSPKTSDTPAMLQNPSIAASPRIVEEFPALSRPATGPAVTPVYEIAPLK